MSPQDLFVGTLSILLGLALLAGSIFDSPSLMQLLKVRLAVEAFGKPIARIIIGLIGVALIALGIAIASGWRIHWAE